MLILCRARDTVAGPFGGDLMIVSWLIWFGTSALAGGFYSPADTAKLSEQYKESANIAGQKASDLEKKASGMATALNQYEEALDLLGSPQAHQTHFTDIRTQFNREFAVASAFVHTMLDDFDSEFSKSLDKALRSHKNAEVCQALRPVGGRALPGIRTRMEPNPDCKGANLNSSLAKAMDADPKLASSVKEILSLEWPHVGQPDTGQPPVGDGDVWIPASRFFEHFYAKNLQEIREDDGAKREALFDAGLEGISTEEKRAALEKGREITKETKTLRRQLALVLTAAIDEINAKNRKKGLTTYSWCPTPQFLGGCTGSSATAGQLDALFNHKRIQKALP